jgi:hypothetical protein
MSRTSVAARAKDERASLNALLNSQIDAMQMRRFAATRSAKMTSVVKVDFHEAT